MSLTIFLAQRRLSLSHRSMVRFRPTPPHVHGARRAEGDLMTYDERAATGAYDTDTRTLIPEAGLDERCHGCGEAPVLHAGRCGACLERQEQRDQEAAQRRAADERGY